MVYKLTMIPDHKNSARTSSMEISFVGNIKYKENTDKAE
jgi:hypothetical protein